MADSMTRDYLYEKDRKERLREAREEWVEERLEEFIEDRCRNFNWDTDDENNHNAIKIMIRKVIKKDRRFNGKRVSHLD